MKKLFLSLLCLGVITIGISAQEVKGKVTQKKATIETPLGKAKVKKTSTPKQKIHNALHPKNKHYSGIKVKATPKKD